MDVTGRTRAGGFPGAGPGTTVTIGAGPYSVAATGPTGYGNALSADCDDTIAPARRRPARSPTTTSPRPTVVNAVLNDDGGTAVVWDEIATGGNPCPPASSAPARTTLTLNPGSQGGRQGARLPQHFASPGCDGTIAAGETKTCTVTHDDLPGTLS